MTATTQHPKGVDRTALKVNQAAIILLLVIAFVANLPWLVIFVAAVMTLGTLSPQLALFQRLYRDLLRPAGSCVPICKMRMERHTASPRAWVRGYSSLLALRSSAD